MDRVVKKALFLFILIISVALISAACLWPKNADSKQACYDCGCDTWMKQDFHCDMASFNKYEAARCFNEYFHQKNGQSYQYGALDISVAYMGALDGDFSWEPGAGYVELLTLGGAHGIDSSGNLYFTGYCG